MATAQRSPSGPETSRIHGENEDNMSIEPPGPLAHGLRPTPPEGARSMPPRLDEVNFTE